MPAPELVKRKPRPESVTALRTGFWVVGLLLAAAQAWVFRYQVSTDSISYLDMSDGVFPGSDWHRLINGVWSPLYPFLLGIFRRIFSVSAPNEIVDAHLLNIVFFIFAFVCFEFFLSVAIRKFAIPDEVSVEESAFLPIPAWAYLSLAYAGFLWASIAEISVRNLRPDMLMSGFVYLAVGMPLRMQGHVARWSDYFLLGTLLGIGFLVKAPLLPIGLLVLAATLFLVENWRPALKMAAASLALVFLIGSLYFVPLSRTRGHFTLGESGAFNYLVHVNHARPVWYLQSVGSGRGSFVHSPEKIFSSPPAYAFSQASTVTHPLRFDPSDWVIGARPRFILKQQIIELVPSLRNLAALVLELGGLMLAALALAYPLWKGGQLWAAWARTWPIWMIGLAGCALYLPVHVESRYVAEFLVLILLGIILGFRIPQNVDRRTVLAFTVVIVVSLLLPLAARTYVKYFEVSQKSNADAQAAAELGELGIGPGDKVARICANGDLGVERVARVQVAAEVDLQHVPEFWSAPLTTQQEILNLFASRGASAVIAIPPTEHLQNNSEWIHLGSTRYWLWLPGRN